MTYADGLAIGNFFLGDTLGATPPAPRPALRRPTSRATPTAITPYSWDAATDDDGDAIDHYVVQHRDADNGVVGLWPSSPTPRVRARRGRGARAEREGTWRYRARAVDATGASGLFSDASEAVKVDRTAPRAPALALHDPPAYADWSADSALVDIYADNGDPLLQDGSAGTGVASSSFDASFLVTSPGMSRGDKDNVGNACPAGHAGRRGQTPAGAPHVAFTELPLGAARHRIQPHRALGRHLAAEVSGVAGDASSTMTFNRVAAGSVVPLRFSLDGPRRRGDRDTLGLDVLADSQPQLAQVACPRRGSVAQPKTLDGIGRSRLIWGSVRRSVHLPLEGGPQEPGQGHLLVADADVQRRHARHEEHPAAVRVQVGRGNYPPRRASEGANPFARPPCPVSLCSPSPPSPAR